MKKNGSVNGQQQKKGDPRKIGRNRGKCERYLLEGRREDNKLRHLKKEVAMNPDNQSAKRALELYLELSF